MRVRPSRDAHQNHRPSAIGATRPAHRVSTILSSHLRIDALRVHSRRTATIVDLHKATTGSVRQVRRVRQARRSPSSTQLSEQSHLHRRRWQRLGQDTFHEARPVRSRSRLREHARSRQR